MPHASADRRFCFVSASILAHWYVSGWFTAGIAIVALVAVSGMVLQQRRRSEDLERLVAERTAELVERSREAEDATAESGQLLRRVSHDLRTPLNNVFGALELAEMQSHRPAEVARWMAVARSASVRLRLMLDDLIAHARDRLDDLDDYAPEAVDAAVAVSEAIEEVRSLAIAKDRVIDIEVDIPTGDESGFVLCEPDALRHLLVDVVTNSLLHGPDGPIVVGCRPSTTSDSTMFEVRDGGLALTDEERAVLETPYRSTDRRRTVGADFAITVAVGIARRLGTELLFEATPEGESVRFSIGNWRGEVLRILMIDDDPTNLEYSATVARSLGHDVRVVNEFVSVAGVLAEYGPDLVVTDHDLGAITGAELLRQAVVPDVQGEPPLWRNRVIVMTSDAQAIAVSDAYRVVLDKPVGRVALAEAIASVSDRRRSGIGRRGAHLDGV